MLPLPPDLRADLVRILYRLIEHDPTLTTILQAAASAAAGADRHRPTARVNDERLRRVHLKLLEKAGAEPIPTKALIRAAGYAVNGWSRGQVSFLAAEGYLEYVNGCVRLGPRRLGDPPLPGAV
jgi:hypothetical protein